ncbi:MAG: protein phosphatase CheZ [Nitrospiraceae bacterium]|nr:MAG: protein phosphatase CheZ [Nitrospiraceae bacterium]
MEQYIGFRNGSSEYMIPILKVREIIKAPSVTGLPHLPKYIDGVTNLRGSIIPILNLKCLLDNCTADCSGSTVIVIATGKITFGIVVDGITGVVNVDPSRIDPPDGFFSGKIDHIEGVAKLEDKLIVLLDTRKLLPLHDISLLEEVAVKVTDMGDGKNVEVIREIETIGGTITVKELHDAKDYLDNKFESDDPKHIVFNKMVKLLDAMANQDYGKVEAVINELVIDTDSDLFREVGMITRKLHDSINDFKMSIDSGLCKITNESVPNAVDKLQFVMNRTEDAANKTMAIVERYFDESDDFSKHIGKLSGPEESLHYLKTFKEAMDNDMTDILTAQQFQDITGQTIKKVISLVNTVEVELVGLISNHGMPLRVENADLENNKEVKEVENEWPSEEPLEKVSQSDVEALLNDFGF